MPACPHIRVEVRHSKEQFSGFLQLYLGPLRGSSKKPCCCEYTANQVTKGWGGGACWEFLYVSCHLDCQWLRSPVLSEDVKDPHCNIELHVPMNLVQRVWVWCAESDYIILSMYAAIDLRCKTCFVPGGIKSVSISRLCISLDHWITLPEPLCVQCLPQCSTPPEPLCTLKLLIGRVVLQDAFS